MDNSIVAVRDLHVEFRAGRGRVARALDGVDLDVPRGQVVALVGESGCGKTTLARTILGLLRPTAGEVLFDGRPLPQGGRPLKDYRRHAQLVFQDPMGSLNPRQTVYEAVAEGLRIHRVRDDEAGRVSRALASSGLRPPERFLSLYPTELSGGQRQRVVIAGAMVLEPTLLVADEPVSSLDASVRGEILQLILQLVQETGVSVLVVTHDLGLAWNIADRVAVMYLGRIVEEGPTEQVLRAPAHPYTQALLSVVPEIEGQTPIVLHGEAPDPAKIPPGCRFHPRCPLVASGEAERLGVVAACRGDVPAMLPVSGGQRAACHAAQADVLT